MGAIDHGWSVEVYVQSANGLTECEATMTISVVYWFMDELPYEIQYFCPGCGKSNYDILPEQLDVLACRGCGMVLDCSQSESSG